ncbi:MAG: D-alanyl-D-alanine carboxypeptidase family protein [Thermodesulfobacteriota bacterium]
MIHTFKKGRRSVFCLIIILFIFSHQAFPQTTQPNLRIHAQSAVLMDALSGQVLYEKNPRSKIGPASFVKILTLYLALDILRDGHLKRDDWVTVSEKAWKTGGSRMFIKVGERVKVEDLLKGIGVVSGNDASVALAEHIAGSEGFFVLEMNKKAQLLGLKDSQFKNPHGLPARDQFTTAFDTAILVRHYIKDHPEALALHSTTEFEYSGIRQQNRNILLKKNIGVDGLMTGHVEESGYHLVATAKRDRQRMIAVVMGCDKLQKRYRDAETLLEYGFKNFSTVGAVKLGALFGPQKVVRGKLNKVHLTPAQEGWVTVAKGKENSISVTPEVPKFIAAPIQKGQVVGKLVIQSEGEILKEIALLSSSDVPKGFYLLWPLIGGGVIGLLLVSLIIYLRFRRLRRVKF